MPGKPPSCWTKARSRGNPFFQIAPAWSIYPLVMLATIATIIASQAIITGSFSMTRQAMQLGWLPGRLHSPDLGPRLRSDLCAGRQLAADGRDGGDDDRIRQLGPAGRGVRHRGLDHHAAHHLPALQSDARCVALAARSRCRAVIGVFLVVDASFFCANLLKIADGGWLPLSFAAVLFVVMVTWRTGIDAMHADAQRSRPRQRSNFSSELKSGAIPRVDGTTVFLTRSSQKVPRLIMDHAHFVGVLPRKAIALSVVFENTPRISSRGAPSSTM